MLATASLVFVLLLAIYRATIMPTVVDQDSGELVAAVHVLGVAHPTGYPLWVLLGRLFDYLPLGGTSAYRVAMLSAVCAAASGGIIAALAATLTGELAAAAFAGLAFGLWFPTWSQAVRAEVYGLTALLTALSLVALLRWSGSRAPRGLAWLALAVGFVSMHHRTAMLALLPALAIAFIMTKPRRARLYLAAGALLVAPFLFYAYLPIRAAARPPVNWTNPSTLPRFLDHMMGAQYTHFAFSHNLEQMIAQAAKLTPELLTASAPLAWALALVGLPLIGWGWWRWAKAQPLVAWALAAGSALLCFWVLQWGETSDLKVFLQPLGEVLALCGAMGAVALARSTRNARAGRIGAAALGGVICVALLGANWERSDLSNLWVHRDRWAAVLQQLEPKAVYVSDNDVPSFATMYLQTVEGMRKDVTLIRVVPLQTDWYVDLIADPVVREATRKAWRETELGMAQIGGQGSFAWNWDRTALFAYLLARELEGERPVYSLHGLQRGGPSGPPYFVSLSEDLVTLESSRSGPSQVQGEIKALVDFGGGLRLIEFGLDEEEPATGALVRFRAVWQVSEALPPPQFGIELRPTALPQDGFERELLPKGRFVQGFPLLNSFGPAAPMATNMVFEQRGRLVIPSNGPGGEYSVSMGIGPPYAVEYQGVTEVARIRVRARPLPRNGP